jgi:ribonuclease D
MVLEDSTALAYETPALKTPEEDLWRVKGVQALNPKALSLLYHLNHLREALAEEQDKPPFKIMGDQALVEIAQTQPRYIQELTLLPSLPQPVLRRYGSRIMTDWRKKPAQVKKRRLPRLSEAELKRRDKLMEWRKNAGVKEGVPSNAIMSKELVGKLAAQEIKSLDELKTLMRHYPQRYARYAQEILALNRKES